MVNNIADAAAN
jgi:hypothetical protein